jgi:hypothetical protein
MSRTPSSAVAEGVGAEVAEEEQPLTIRVRAAADAASIIARERVRCAMEVPSGLLVRGIQQVGAGVQ